MTWADDQIEDLAAQAPTYRPPPRGDTSLMVRLTPAEKAIARELAARGNRSMTEFIRHLITQAQRDAQTK